MTEQITEGLERLPNPYNDRPCKNLKRPYNQPIDSSILMADEKIDIGKLVEYLGLEGALTKV